MRQNYIINLIMSDLRATIMADQELIASKSRFGLFSQPPPLAIGDDSPYKQKKKTRGQNGKPITQPAQMLTGPCRTGVTKSAYFQVPQSILQGDPFKQRYKQEIQYDRKMHTRSTFHENQFKPASAYRTLMSSSYKYKEQNPQTTKKIVKDQAGKVKTEAKNFTTNPISKVENDFFKPPKHMPDQYNRKRQFEKKQREIWRKKLPQATFKSMSHGNKPLMKDSLTFGQDGKAKQMLAKKKQRPKTASNTFNHEAPFKLAVKYPGDTISRFPGYIANKTTQQLPKKRVSHTKDQGKQKWKPNSWNVSRPTPSVTLHPRNIHIGRYK